MKVCPQCGTEYEEAVDFCPTDGMKLRARRTESEDPLIGRALDKRWVIEEKLGEGGMGAVYRGHQQSVSRTVAIKTLRPQLVESDEFVDRFFREAKIAASISHPHCVTILDYGESSDGTLYLAMEFLEGELLTDRIESGDLTVKQVVEIGIQVSSALSAAHDQNIVHRDLKPDNIFLLDVPGGGTFSKVLDFGIAKMLDSNTQVTKTGMIFGTPEYMSPEQCRGDALDGRSDLYSLGCILYELVGGRTPFRATTPMAVLMAHVNEDAKPLRTAPIQADIPAGLDQVIMRLLEKLPERRFQSAGELRQALENLLANLENPSASIGASAIVADEVAIGFGDTMGLEGGEIDARPSPEETKTGPSDAPTKGGSNNKALLGLAAILLVAVLVVGGVVAKTLLSDGTAANAETETAAAVAPADEANANPSKPDEPAEVAAEETAGDPADPSEEDEAAPPAEELAAADDGTESDEAKEAVVAEAKPKKRRTKRARREAEPEASDEPAPTDDDLDDIVGSSDDLEIDIEALSKDVDTTSTPVPKEDKPQPETKESDDKPKPKTKPRKRRPFKDLNKEAERIRDDVVDGLFGR